MDSPQSFDSPLATAAPEPASSDSSSNGHAAAPASEEAPGAESVSFGDILSEFEQRRHAEGPAQAIQGTVITVSQETVFVDIGRKMEGTLEAGPFRDASGQITLKPGDSLLVSVTGRDAEGYYTLSTVKVERPKDWSSLERAFSEKQAIAGRVVEAVKGGLRVDVGVPAFMPASRSGVREVADLEKLIGQEIQCRIIKLDVAGEDVVVDRRVILEEEAARARQERFASLKEGDVVWGTVRSLTEFGAFLDLGGVDGLLHVTDMAWTRVNKPSEVVKAGDSLEVKVLKINPETRKISLGLKQLVPDPWSLAAEKYKVGERVRGKVARLADFGAFVELEPGVDGLIHLSELSWSKKIRKPSDVLKVGEWVEVVVLGVNAAERRIALGLKQALGDPWEQAATRFPAGTVIEGPVTNLTKFGAFVELGDGVEGMIHIADITREKRLNHPREALSVGQRVRAQVLEVDGEKRRIRLGMKQLEPTTADEYIAEHHLGEVVSGRVVSVEGSRATVELGEGVHAACRIPAAAPAAAGMEGGAPRKADLSAMSAMLAARWKGSGTPPAAAANSAEPVKPGQIRSFRIVALDPAQKGIGLELAG